MVAATAVVHKVAAILEAEMEAVSAEKLVKVKVAVALEVSKEVVGSEASMVAVVLVVAMAVASWEATKGVVWVAPMVAVARAVRTVVELKAAVKGEAVTETVKADAAMAVGMAVVVMGERMVA